MLSANKLNVKALQELVLYYLRERITHKNVAVKYLIATNINDWFIFDASIFDRLFAQNKNFVQQFTDFENGRLADTKTDFYYKQIAEPFIETVIAQLEYTYFDLQTFQKPLRNADKADDVKLINLFKILSPEHLLKLPFANDSNSLDKKFYSELLHIIGLTETKEGSKKLIERNKEGERNTGSILEDTIIQLDSLDKINRLDKQNQYGTTAQERLFAVGLELSITWVNRILFLKLLEAQLIAYNKGDTSYAFLNADKIKNYDDLNSLFFQVLARRYEERNEDVKKLFEKVPYLNSSLFEPTEIEQVTLLISNLKDDKTIPIINTTVLKNEQGKKRTGNLTTLTYLFQFLDAYDFTSEGASGIQYENKSLINASVLGLIFEKINGYKDGSFFTPGFITMYMCKETIRKAVLQKFNETKKWNCNDIHELYDKIEDRNEANKIVNSIKICDPAVGSGHFLVSALNEIIAVKNDLKILQDLTGKRLKEYQVEVVNDELIVTDEDGDLFEYNPTNKESQRIQETLFHEKQTIIENCLFGVDINTNSVKICRLRLWIELLKNAYYKSSSQPPSTFGEGPGVRSSFPPSPTGEGTGVRSNRWDSSPSSGELEGAVAVTGVRSLETLPNIDINIKCGNSLVSRFAIDADLSIALKKSKWTIDSYKIAVATYRNAESKEQKREMEKLIADIKSDFRSEISLNDPKIKKLNKLNGDLFSLTNQTTLFEKSKKEKADWNKQVEKLTTDAKKLETEIEDIKANKIYENAFEWRFEFPEVLNDAGDFIGFDVVIGNPPYMRVQEIEISQPDEKKYYEKTYSNANAAYDLANLFFELGIRIANKNANNSFIFPHKFFNSASSENFRNYLTESKFIDKIAHFGANMVFEDADTYTCIAWFSKNDNKGFYFQRFPFKSNFQKLMLDNRTYEFISYEMLDNASKQYGSNQWIMFNNKKGFNIFEKIYTNSKLFSDVFEGIFQGLATSKDELFILEKISDVPFKLRVQLSNKEYELEQDLFKPFLMGKDVKRFSHLTTNKYVFFPYRIKNGNAEIIELDEIKKIYPNSYKYLIDHQIIFKERERGKAGKMKNWYGYIYPKNLNKFEQLRLTSMEICSIHPNVTLNSENLYHTTKAYSWVKRNNVSESYEYLLAIANSKLLWWFLKTIGDTLQGDARTFKTNYLNPFPIPKTLLKDSEVKIGNLTSSILNIKKENPKADTTDLETQIDQLVYQLYNLTPEEIKIVEGN